MNHMKVLTCYPNSICSNRITIGALASYGRAYKPHVGTSNYKAHVGTSARRIRSEFPLSRALMMHPLQIDTICTSRLHRVRLPPSVCFSVFEHCVGIAKRLSHYEGKPTGCILVLAGAELLSGCRRLSNTPSSILRKKITDDTSEGSLRETFAADGGMLIDGQGGEILATKVRFATRPTEFSFIVEGHGTRHHEALDVACGEECVAITRSQDGYVTIFSSEHLRCSPDEARCFRVQDEPDQRESGQFKVVMDRTSLVRFDANGKMDFPRQASDALRSLQAPLQVVAFVGPGRTGKSTLAGQVVGNSLLFPAAKVLDAVTDGIDAVAIQNPGIDGTLLVLDSEGFDNVFAKSRPEVATLCLLLCSQIVCVDYDRLDDKQMTSLAKLSACREALMPSGDVAADNLDPHPPELVVVVNGSRFHDLCDSKTLEKALSSDEGNADRQGCREAVRKHFPCRHFASIPVSTHTDFETQVRALQDIVLQAPLLLTAGSGLLGEFVPANRQCFDGTMFRDLVSRSLALMNNGSFIQPRDVYQSVLRDRDERSIKLALAFFERQLPIEGVYRSGLKYQPGEAMQQVDVSHMTTEARQRLDEVLRRHYDEVERENDKKGQAPIGNPKMEEERVADGPPSYSKIQKTEWMVAGGAAGAFGGAAAGCAVVATGGLALLAMVPGAAFAGTFTGAMLGQGQTQYTKKQRFQRRRRTITNKVNGEVVRGEWLHVEYIDTEEVVDKDDVPRQLQ